MYAFFEEQDFGNKLADQLPQLKGVVIQSQVQVHSLISGNSISFKISESHNAFFTTSLEYQNEDNKLESEKPIFIIG